MSLKWKRGFETPFILIAGLAALPFPLRVAAQDTAGKSSSGDMYAGHDGNVYQNTGSGWQKYNNSSNSWQSVNTQQAQQQAQQDKSNYQQQHPDSQANMQQHEQSFNQDRSPGVGTRGASIRIARIAGVALPPPTVCPVDNTGAVGETAAAAGAAAGAGSL